MMEGTEQGSAMGDAAAGVAEDVRGVAHDAKQLAGEVAGAAKKTAGSQVTRGKDMAADGLGSVASALRHAEEKLLSEEQHGAGEYVSHAAYRVEQASTYLRTRTLGQVVGDVEGFARRDPALFLGGAFLLGLLGGRFLKSSAPSAARAGVGGEMATYGGGDDFEDLPDTHPAGNGGATSRRGRGGNGGSRRSGAGSEDG